jgi:hypothetical protein
MQKSLGPKIQRRFKSIVKSEIRHFPKILRVQHPRAFEQQLLYVSSTMVSSPIVVDGPSAPSQGKWSTPDKQTDTPTLKANGAEVANGQAHPADQPIAQSASSATVAYNGSAPPEAGSDAGTEKNVASRGEKQIKVLVRSHFRCML